jgi:hypothetical protein
MDGSSLHAQVLRQKGVHTQEPPHTQPHPPPLLFFPNILTRLPKAIVNGKFHQEVLPTDC